MPNIAPVASASPINRGVTAALPLLPLMLTNPIATIASAAPISGSVDGVVSETRPTIIGISAAVTALIGAKIAMAPRARPR